MIVTSTTRSTKLAEKIANEMSLVFCPVRIKKFRCGEFQVNLECFDHKVVVVASLITCEDFFEVFFLLDALKNSKIILAISYLGYLRQEREVDVNGISCSNSVITKLLNFDNVAQVILLDPHVYPRFFSKCKIISAIEMFANEIIESYKNSDFVVISPDIGGVERAEKLANRIGAKCIFCKKSKDIFNKIKSIDVFGNVNGKICILIDDIIDSGATIWHCANELWKQCPVELVVCCTHYLGNPDLDFVDFSGKLVVTDSMHCGDYKYKVVRELSVSSLFARSILCLE